MACRATVHMGCSGLWPQLVLPIKRCHQGKLIPSRVAPHPLAICPLPVPTSVCVGKEAPPTAAPRASPGVAVVAFWLDLRRS